MAKKDTKNDIDLTGKIEKCYLLYGVDTYSRRAWEDKIKKKVVDEAAELMNLSVFNDVKTTAGQVIEATETFPFLADKRFILVKDCGFFSEGKKAESDLLADYIADIPETTCIVFSEEKADKRLKLYKAAEKNGKVAVYDKLKDDDLAVILEKKLTKNGIKTSKSVCMYMVRNCGADLEQLKTESDKLLAYLGDKKTVTIEDIDAVCAKNAETKVFDMIDAMIAGNKKKAIEIYRNMLLYNEQPVGILYLISRQFRIIIKCKNLNENGYSDADIAKKLGLHPFAAKGAVRQSRGFSYEDLEKALNKCIETDYMIKSGRVDDEVAVEMLILG